MTTTTDARVRDSATATAARGRWLMLIVLLAGQFMALLDETVRVLLRYLAGIVAGQSLAGR